jgi:hypothetical protein
LRALVLVKATGIVFQFEVFMRTDLYALFVVVTGCRNLWATKGAVARRLVGRATDADLAHLSGTAPREIRWARVYLCLYVPGVIWAVGYFAFWALPALYRIAALSADSVRVHGLASPLGAAGAVALALTVASTGFVLWGLLRTGYRLARGRRAQITAGSVAATPARV